ncbi:Zinc transport system substrate-binding protein [Candidatus Magnetaquicoccaceae bacterium FCR-1]|uniref:High-affinity zinc uptake system protein ZnuA n=1 Tax=Candidatus Magnetaquiglobus chichijimensis TaxID=3141448 RepID=A0ABQ0C7H4_9PROT
MKIRFPSLPGAALMLVLMQPSPASALEVVVSIKPLHALAAAVMETTGKPTLLIQGHVSEHTHALRPSDARLLSHAEVIFWAGPELEGYLKRPLENLAPQAHQVALLATPGLHRLPMRQGGVWEGDDHDHSKAGDDHDHADHDDHTPSARTDDHDHANRNDHAPSARTDDHDHANRDDHAPSAKAVESNAHKPPPSVEKKPIDPHAWLDPRNAAHMASAMAETLARRDPERAARYRDNAQRLAQKLATLDTRLAKELQAVRKRPYIVFHDAYQYFESRYGLNSVGSILVNPEQPPGAKRVSEIAARLRATGARCLFAEPQFPQRMVDAVSAGQPVRVGVLDPLGAAFPEGPELYFELMDALTRALRDCLLP